MLSCFQGNSHAIAEGTTIPSAAQVWFLRESSGANYGLHYYHNRTQKLLWSCDGVLKLSTLNFLSSSESDTQSWLFSHFIQDVSYDAKNKRLFILSYTHERDDTFYVYRFDIENTTPFGNVTEFRGFTSNNDYHQGSISVAND